MKLIVKYLLIAVLAVIIFLFGFNYKDNMEPSVLYNVYLNNELIETIE